jgi:hypothetical protein
MPKHNVHTSSGAFKYESASGPVRTCHLCNFVIGHELELASLVEQEDMLLLEVAQPDLLFLRQPPLNTNILPPPQDFEIVSGPSVGLEALEVGCQRNWTIPRCRTAADIFQRVGAVCRWCSRWGSSSRPIQS